MEYTITHNEAQHRFEIDLDATHKAIVAYKMMPDAIAFLHTEVPTAYEGKGIAGQLAKFVLDYAASNHLHVRPYCPYIKSYIDRHPEYQENSVFHNPALGAR